MGWWMVEMVVVYWLIGCVVVFIDFVVVEYIFDVVY